MVLFQKNFADEALQTEDLLAVLGIDEETAKDGNIGIETDGEKVTINRSKTQAMLIAEEMKANITIEQENGELRIVISKKI